MKGRKDFFARNLEYFLIITNQHDQKKSSDAICGPRFSVPRWQGLKRLPGPQGSLLRERGVRTCRTRPCPSCLVSCPQHCPELHSSGKCKQTKKSPPAFPLPAPLACGTVTKEAALPITHRQPFKQTRVGQG